MPFTFSAESLRDLGIPGDMAASISKRLEALPKTASAADAWSDMCRSILPPTVPFSQHVKLYNIIFADWDRTRIPPPAWTPAPRDIETSNIAALCKRTGLSSYDELYAWSVTQRAEFWQAVIDMLGIRLARPPSGILDPSQGVESPRWLPGAKLNIAESCFGAAGTATAIVYRPEGGAVHSMTFEELDKLSNRVANSLGNLGIGRGDAVAVAMPMTAEAVAAYLGIVKAGGAVVSIADSFAADEIGTRLRISGARTIVTQDVVLRAGKVLPMHQKVTDAGADVAIVIPAGDHLRVSLRKTDVEWREFLHDNDAFEPVPCDPDDTTNILFSSGTTGDPKAIPWTNTTPIKCAMDGLLHHDIKEGDVVCWPTNLGWMMGPWLIYASLINGAAMALYYGSPGSQEFCEFVQDAKVTMLGLVPSLVKAWRSGGTIDGLDWRAIKTFSSTGESSNAEDMLYLMSRAQYRPIVEYCGGTEIGGGYITGTRVQPASPATFSTAALGLGLHILDENGNPTNNGELFIVPPSIGLSNSLLNRDHHEVYFEGTPAGPGGERLRRHGDQMEHLGGGYYRAHGRADDTMNLSGIKVSSAEIERTVNALPGVLETAAIAVESEGGGPSLLVIYTVTEPSAEADAGVLGKLMQRAISEHLNPLFRVHKVVLIDALPRTASNKVMRRVLRSRYAEANSAG
jgi:acetyl-CoA synthetase